MSEGAEEAHQIIDSVNTGKLKKQIREKLKKKIRGKTEDLKSLQKGHVSMK